MLEASSGHQFSEWIGSANIISDILKLASRKKESSHVIVKKPSNFSKLCENQMVLGFPTTGTYLVSWLFNLYINFMFQTTLNLGDQFTITSKFYEI